MADDLQEEIKKVAEKIPGCCYVSLVGYDGITIAQHSIETNFDVTLYDAELSSIMLASKEVKGHLDLNVEQELIWLTSKLFFIIRPINEDYFVYACLKPTGSNPGLARLELNKLKGVIHKIIQSET